MSDAQTSTSPTGDFSQAGHLSALFASLVLQQSNMALMMLGKVPPPEGGEPFQDIDSARVFIDQLEMLEAKTRGNLTKEEEKLLRQNLTALRMAFVEAVEARESARPSATTTTAPTAASAPPSPSPTTEGGARPAPDGAADAPHKKFSKKY